MEIFLTVLLALILWLITDLHTGNKKRKLAPSSSRQKMTGNLTFINDGDDFFRALINDIDAAVYQIHMMFYIFRDDATGHMIIEHLCQKATSGVSVYLLVDYGGSHSLKKATIRKMTSCGIVFSYSRKISFPRFFTSINERNHRKITVIDGEIGYVGGFNVGNEYVGKDPKFGYWRDYHLRVTGEAVQGLQDQFFLDWEESHSPINKHNVYIPPLETGQHKVSFHITNGNSVEEAFASYIDKATTSIIIGSPYYIPGQTVQTSLLRALKCGIKVQVILPMRADHPLVKEASYEYLVELIRAGGEVYQYMNGFYHAKVMIIDETLCDIGTANFDQRSFHINGEINCIISTPSLIVEIKEAIQKDILQCERLDLKRLQDRTIGNRVLAPLARLFSPFL
ncbi:cardiolipin synthase [Alkalihalobacillus hwajinpoensis]|uniref:cardiolipin synthase n=1 Tax=Guptibacillus hwajinpoensis TaxID=208199 RepID=UPI00188391D5|nr:cardiolipin synthase [Pseudalkalibacillus hwajinpoensis]MBF0705208.1 cardiolipin synthase [Pseudalkalibacillus hwajinpoensis]